MGNGLDERAADLAEPAVDGDISAAAVGIVRPGDQIDAPVAIDVVRGDGVVELSVDGDVPQRLARLAERVGERDAPGQEVDRGRTGRDLCSDGEVAGAQRGSRAVRVDLSPALEARGRRGVGARGNGGQCGSGFSDAWELLRRFRLRARQRCAAARAGGAG